MAASIINTNVMSLNAQRHLNKNAMGLATALERLSSGLRINSARDDAAGLAVATSLEADVRGYSVQIRNAADDISANQTADGALAVATDILLRMSELAVQAQGTNGKANVDKINAEYSSLNATLSTIGAGSYQPTVTSLTSANGASAATAIASQLDAVATQRATYGAAIASAEFQVQNFEVARENAAAAESRIMDADFAAETASLTRGQILQQAGTAMVAQANSIPNNVLALLR